MKLVLLFLVGAFIAPSSFAAYFGSMNVEGYGEVHIVGRDWVGDYVQVSSNELRLNGGGRVYFASKPNNDFSGDMWWKVVQNTYFQ